MDIVNGKPSYITCMFVSTLRPLSRFLWDSGYFSCPAMIRKSPDILWKMITQWLMPAAMVFSETNACWLSEAGWGQLYIRSRRVTDGQDITRDAARRRKVRLQARPLTMKDWYTQNGQRSEERMILFAILTYAPRFAIEWICNNNRWGFYWIPRDFQNCGRHSPIRNAPDYYKMKIFFRYWLCLKRLRW